MIGISFAWTADALLAGRKTCTCRDWTDGYAKRFRAGDLVAAYDRSPRFRGTQIATIRLTHNATHGVLPEIVPDWYEREGFAYYDEQLDEGNTKAIQALARAFGLRPGETLMQRMVERGIWGKWIVRFEVVEP
ncbi:MAG: ASCH domain-containing protein [Gemmatimonadaceae bacterium]|nr:ASCH domain-containing protein [Gemmatimonadaceae bacterium]